MDSQELQRLVQRHLDQRLDDTEFARLQEALQSDSVARAAYAKAARFDAELRESAAPKSEETPASQVHSPSSQPAGTSEWTASSWLALAALMVAVALPAWILWQAPDSSSTAGSGPTGSIESANFATRGVAVITAQADAVWGGDGGHRLGPGMALEPGPVFLEEGLAQIDFFGGASVSLSGPAQLELLHRDAAILHKGTLKARVPPAARGFVIHASDVVLEDLGTSFGLSVGQERESELIVFDGEVQAIGQNGEPLLLTDGEAARLAGGSAFRRTSEGLGDFPDITDVIAGSGGHEEVRYASWKEASLDRRRDPRLIAYYDFEGLTAATRRLRNQALHGLGSELDGGIVGARVAEGRWNRKTALDFRSVGDRVRFHIPGEYDAITLYAWVRIDALDRTLNSLFLTDYFDENEIHWQISREGHLHFAVSPMGVIDIPANNRRFFSDSFWDPRQSGRWFLLATTVERGVGRVAHYINGKPLGFSGGTNREKPVPPMRIGDADLGNWSDPIWDHSIRTLNGRIDEFALYADALSPEEISTIYEEGKP